MSMPQLSGKSLTFSKGIKNLKTFSALFPESDDLCFGHRLNQGNTIRQVIGWGKKENTEKPRKVAEKNNLPYLSLEDGFYRSLQPGVLGEPPLSLILDDLGIYYDATTPSRLEEMLQQGGWQTPVLLQRAELLIGLIRKYYISKYNHAPFLSEELPGDQPRKVLVVDQTFGDRSVSLGYADQSTFKKMLADAFAENPDADIIIKTHPDVIAGKKQGHFSGHDVSSPRIHLIGTDLNPISLLAKVDKVYVVSSQLGFEALLCDRPVTCYGMPFYSGWGLTEDKCQCPRRTARRSLLELFAAACILYPRYLNPETGQAGEIEDLFAHFVRYSRLRMKFSGTTISCKNFYWWKKQFVRKLFAPLGFQLQFSKTTISDKNTDTVMVWGRRDKVSRPPVADNISPTPLVSMEDGFVRSVGLGSDYVMPLSLVLDQKGIYFNPQQPSDLEVILEQSEFSALDIKRAKVLRQRLLTGQISKYSVGNETVPQFNKAKGRRIILVPGQVEDDASIQLGCVDIRTNLGLLQQVRKEHQEAFIVYKPHPDVVSGNRIGAIPKTDALTLCDEIVTDLSMPSCLQACDEVHTLTSLTGFEALLRGKTVVTYGLPFYAGWGLTRDRHRCTRRSRSLSLDELVCGTLIHYPVYIDPDTQQLISVERAVDILTIQKSMLKTRAADTSWWTRKIRKLHGLIQWNLCR